MSSVLEAKNNFSQLIEKAEKGEEVVITKHGKPVAELVPYTPRKVRLGAESHLAPFPEGWEKPMTDQEVSEYYGEV